MIIAAAANLMTPAYLTILSKDYSVHGEGDWMIAIRGEDRFIAEGPIELLGVIAVAEARGANWQASDAEIDDFVSRFG